MSVAERRTKDGSIVCIQTDITRLREQEAKIRESERRLKVILDTAADAILTIDENGPDPRFQQGGGKDLRLSRG